MKTVFVSSTFKDMHYERDAIRLITAPLVNEEARKYGDEFDFCDLRWGIDTGDLDTYESSKKVLDVCLDEIDRCEPPMVVLLGERYGWIPEAALIKTAAERKKLELDDLERSVTALEIEYGSLCDDHKFRNTLFYFREIEGNVPSDYLAEDDEHAKKISALKNRIKGLSGGRIKDYTLTWNGNGFDGVDDFAEMLAEDITAMLMPAWKETENLTPFERERKIHWTFIREKNVMFRARQAEAEKRMRNAVSQPVTIIKGGTGSGKSTLFSHMATELEKTEWTVLPFISGLTTESSSADDIIKNIVYFIEEQLHINHYIDKENPRTGEKQKHTPDEWRDKLAERCSEYAKPGLKLLIMLDAADQLTPSEERDQLHFIPMSVSENIHFVMTCTVDFETPGREYHTLRKLDNDKEKRAVISGILARNGRELSGSVINEMMKLKASDNPLYLSLLVQRLLMMNSDDYTDIRSRGDGMAAIEQHQTELIKNKCPNDLDGMSAALLSEAGKRINEKLVSQVAEYLAVSRNGLRRKDLSALLGEEWAEIDFSHFINYMNDCFLQRDDGRYDFTHKSIRAGFRSQCSDLGRVNREILDYYKSLKTDDTVGVSEVIYHAIKADDKRFFVRYVIRFMNKKNQPHINWATKDTYAQCIADNGKWMIDVLNEAKKYEADEKLIYLCDFCNYYLNEAFSGSQKELDIRLSIMSANIDFMEHLYRKLKTDSCKRELTVSYERAAGIYEWMGSRENLGQALELYHKSLEIREQLAQELDTADSKRDLSANYGHVAIIYKKLDGKENLERALELYHKAFVIREHLTEELGMADSKRDLSASYEGIADIYDMLSSRENLQKALELYHKSLEINEQLAEELGTDTSKDNLSDTYEKTGALYEKLGGRENLQKALELYHKCLEIRKQLAKKLGTADSRRDFSVSYHKVGGIYDRLGGRENLERALELFHKSLEINEQLAQELGTAGSKRDLYVAYESVARIYDKLGGRENLEKGSELYNKMLKISKQLAQELGTAENKRDLSISYERVAGIYERLGDRTNLERALKLCQKALKIREQQTQELGTADSKMALTISYDNVARIYDKLSGGENLKLALDLYQKSLEIREQQAKELGTADNKRGLSLSYQYVAAIYMKLMGRENLERAVELFQKSIQINEQLTRESGTVDNRRDLWVSYQKLGEIYEFFVSGENLNQALELYHKALNISEQLAREADTAEIKRDLSGSYERVASIYGKLGGRENLDHALELYRECLSIREQQSKELATADSKRNLYFIYNSIAGIYEQFEEREDLEHALELYQKGLEINEQLAKEVGTAEIKRDLAICCYKVGGIYEELGGKGDLEQSLELYHKSLEISEQLANTLKTSLAYDDLVIGLQGVAVHPLTAVSDKKKLLNRGLKILKMLYAQTKMDRYKDIMNFISEELDELS